MDLAHEGICAFELVGRKQLLDLVVGIEIGPPDVDDAVDERWRRRDATIGGRA
jgi:hypothetical protein